MAPIDLYNKLKSYYVGHDDQEKPVLSTRSSALFSVLFVALYVVPFYLSRKTRPSPTLNRDAPSVIRARIQTVTSTVILSTLSTFYILSVTGKHTVASSLHYLGVFPIDPVGIIKAFVLTLILYLAPLYETLYIEEDLAPLSSLLGRVKASLNSSQGFRNYVAGPLTEELLFRSTIVTLHLLAHVSATKITYLTPLYFGIAHMHHFYEFRLTHPYNPFIQAVLRSVFQFGYTTIFGWYASFIYLRTGNLYAVFIIHAFCNWMGLPRLYGRVKIRSEPNLSSVVVRRKDDPAPLSRDQPGYETPLKYTVIYYALLCGGGFGFYKCLFILTENSGALASFSEK